jgi:Sigma-70, region 4
MASLDSLPPDQRAVLQLVLQRGRSYDEIAKMLSIDRAGVRDRALQAFDALGPQTRVPAERRALITDYLLGQLPSRVADDTRDRLAGSASERAWARVIASELSSLTNGRSLPEIPLEAATVRDREPAPARGATHRPGEDEFDYQDDEDAGSEFDRHPSSGREETFVATQSVRRRGPADRTGAHETLPSSRRGGAIVLGVVGALVVAAVVVLIIVLSGGSSSNKPSASVTTTTTANAHTSATTSTSASGSATPVAQINLRSPTGASTTGVAILVRQGSTVGVVIRAAHVPPNTKHDAYAVWLNTPAGTSHLLGFVNPGVGSNGTLTTAGALPTNAGSYKELLVTLETQSNPKSPGKIVLQGALTGL